MRNYHKLLCAPICGLIILAATITVGAGLVPARSRYQTRGQGQALPLLQFSSLRNHPPPCAVTAHKFYASLAQADLNAETNSLEISLRLFSDDLELALTRRAGRAIYLDQPEVAAPLVLAYLREKFELKNAAGQLKELTWVGMEPRVDATWIYFEIRDVGDLTGATLRNRIFFEQFDEQTNTVNIRRGDRRTALVFRQGDDFKTIFAA